MFSGFPLTLLIAVLNKERETPLLIETNLFVIDFSPIAIGKKRSCRNPGSNQGPLDLQSNALPTELFRPPGRRGRGAALLAFLFQEVGFNGGWLGFGFPTCGGPARSSRTPAGRKGLDCVLGACCSHPVPDRGGGQVEDRDGRDVPGIRWKTWPAPRHPAS